MERQQAQPRAGQTEHMIVIDSGLNPQHEFVGSYGLVKSARKPVLQLRSLYRKLIPKPIRVSVRQKSELPREILHLALSSFSNDVRKQILFSFSIGAMSRHYWAVFS